MDNAKLVNRKLYCENILTEYTKIFRTENFNLRDFDIFLIFAQNIDCGVHVRIASARRLLQAPTIQSFKLNAYFYSAASLWYQIPDIFT